MVAVLFPYTRSIGRGEYAIRLLVCLLISVPLLLWRWQVVHGGHVPETLAFLGVLLVALFVIQAQTIPRLRDADASMLLSFLVYVPYLNAAFALALLLLPHRAASSRAQEQRAPGPAA